MGLREAAARPRRRRRGRCTLTARVGAISPGYLRDDSGRGTNPAILAPRSWCMHSSIRAAESTERSDRGAGPPCSLPQRPDRAPCNSAEIGGWRTSILFYKALICMVLYVMVQV